MRGPLWEIESSIEANAWPALPGSAGATVLGLLFQLEDTQWLSADELRALQEEQLELLLRHAYETVPFYRERWPGPPRAGHLAELPLLRRADLQDRYEDLKSRAIPAAHGTPAESSTSGSTGTPLRILKTPLCGLLWNAFTLRDHAWHGRDPAGKLAVIRLNAKEAQVAAWGPATAGLVKTGSAVLMGIDADVERQLAWLERENPDYLLAYPTNVAELARASLRSGTRLPKLRQVRTFSEMLLPEVRELCREAWGVPLVDTYSSVETGYLALQCPEHEHYHVQSEGVLLEVLDERGQSCGPGEVGRVVVTVLHNFSMPLVRYDIGDFAEAGAPCPCGRGLAVLRRIERGAGGKYEQFVSEIA